MLEASSGADRERSSGASGSESVGLLLGARVKGGGLHLTTKLPCSGDTARGITLHHRITHVLVTHPRVAAGGHGGAELASRLQPLRSAIAAAVNHARRCRLAGARL